MTRTRWILLGVVGAVLLVVAFFDWNWLRVPVENYVTRKTHREFKTSDLHVKLGLSPTIRLRDVRFANAPWGQAQPEMAKIGLLEFSVSLRDLFDGRVLIPQVALTDADVHLEQLPDKHKNWIISDPSDTSPSKLRISSLSVTRGHLDFVDRGIPFQIGIEASTFDPQLRDKASDATARPDNSKYAARYEFAGQYHDAKFSGNALTGEVLSFQESGIPFPIQGHLLAGTTKLDLEGTVTDAAKLSAIDVQLHIAGQTLANLYPFLALPLPASPPYQLSGHLTQAGAKYTFDEFNGKIGSTDVAGSGSYLQQNPRPLLHATLHSHLLKVSDLGPLVGVTSKKGGASEPTQAATNTKAAAKATEKKTNGDRILPAGTTGGDRLLPSGKFEGGRLKAIDATAQYTADRIDAPGQLEVQKVQVGLVLKDAVLKLDPLKVSVAGGSVDARIGLDAREPDMIANVQVAAQKLHLAQLMPSSPTIEKAQGTVGGLVNLAGTGASIADLAAKSDGKVSVVMSSAKVSNLLDAAAGLNGGKVVQLLIAGDKRIAVRCGAVAFDVKSGQGVSRLFLIDTDQTRINGSGTFDLDHEKFDLEIEPEPKHPSLLSLRTPLRLYGTFRHPDYALDKKGLALRGGGALALALVAPWAALLPLIETGPGEDADCKKLTAGQALAPKPLTHARK